MPSVSDSECRSSPTTPEFSSERALSPTVRAGLENVKTSHTADFASTSLFSAGHFVSYTTNYRSALSSL